MIPVVPKSKGLRAHRSRSIPVRRFQISDLNTPAVPPGRSVQTKDLRDRSVPISRLSKSVGSRTGPDVGADPESVAGYRRGGGDARHACACQRSLTEMRRGTVRLRTDLRRVRAKDGDPPPFAKTRRRVGHRATVWDERSQSRMSGKPRLPAGLRPLGQDAILTRAPIEKMCDLHA